MSDFDDKNDRIFLDRTFFYHYRARFSTIIGLLFQWRNSEVLILYLLSLFYKKVFVFNFWSMRAVHFALFLVLSALFSITEHFIVLRREINEVFKKYVIDFRQTPKNVYEYYKRKPSFWYFRIQQEWFNFTSIPLQKYK